MEYSLARQIHFHWARESGSNFPANKLRQKAEPATKSKAKTIGNAYGYFLFYIMIVTKYGDVDVEEAPSFDRAEYRVRRQSKLPIGKFANPSSADRDP